MQDNEFILVKDHPTVSIYNKANEIVNEAKKLDASFLNILIERNKVPEISEESIDFLFMIQYQSLKYSGTYEPEEQPEYVVYSLDELKQQNSHDNKGPYLVCKASEVAYKALKEYRLSLWSRVELMCPGIKEEIELLEKQRQLLIQEWELGEWPTQEYTKYTHPKFNKTDFCFKDYKDKPGQLCRLINALIYRWGHDGEFFKIHAYDDIIKQYSDFLTLEFKIIFLVDRLKYIYAFKGNSVSLDSKQKPLDEKYKTLDDLFLDKSLISDCFNVLIQGDGLGEGPILNNHYKFIGKIKGAFCIWIELLKQFDLIHSTNDEQYADLLIKRFEGLNSFDPSSFRKGNSRASNKYKEVFKNKLSLISQKGKLRK